MTPPDYYLDDWDDDPEEESRWPGPLTYLIILIFICAMLYPILVPVLREIRSPTRPTPTPTLHPDVVWLRPEPDWPIPTR